MDIQEKLMQEKISKRQKELPLEPKQEVVEDIPKVKKEANIPVFPKPERMFPEDARPKGGEYLNPITKESITGKNVSNANIKITPEGKPSFKVSDDNVAEVGSTGKGKSIIRVNLFKKKAGWKWQDAPEGYEDAPTLVSVEHKGKHFYTLETDFDKGVNLSRYPDKKSEPRLRPTVTGQIELGPQVGTISVRGKEHPVYEKIRTYDKGGLGIAPNPSPKQEESKRDLKRFEINTYDFDDVGERAVVDFKGGGSMMVLDMLEMFEKLGTGEEPIPSKQTFKKVIKFLQEKNPTKEEFIEHFKSKDLNQGGTAMKDQMQIAFMNEGGMKDDGGETEPTSGNKVPSGSLKEEVKDDIPAMLSEGEFVFPADVVRYIGLETLMKMRQDAKQGLKMMEKMGQLGNPEEAELPDDIPFGMADLVVVSGEMKDKEKKAEGGAVGLANGGSLFDDPRFQTGDSGQDPTVYTPEEEEEIKGALDEPLQPTDIQIKKIISPSDPNDFMMWSFDKEGNPLYPLPEGYVVDDTPVEDSYSNIISRREQPTDSDSGDSGQMVDPRDSAGMTLPKADEFIDSDLYGEGNKKGKYALFSKGKPIRLQKTTLDNLSMEYEKLKEIDPKLTFEQYYNLPTYDKVRFSLRSSLGRDPDAKEINAAIKQAQQSPTGLLSFLNPVVGAIKSFLSPDASGGFTDKEYKEQRDKRDKAVRNLTNLIDPSAESPYKTNKEGKLSDAEYQKYKTDIALESQAKFPSTGKVGKVDDFLLGIRRDPNKPDEPPKIMTPQGEQDLTPDALGRIEKNRQEQQNINQRLDAADRDRQERGFGPMSVQEREEKRQEEFTGFTSSGDFIGPTDPGTAAMNRFYVGGVPTKPMKPQRLKKGGIASPKAKPKKMKKGGLASSRKK